MRLFDIFSRRKTVREEYMGRDKDSFVSRWAWPPSRNTAEWLQMFAASPRLSVVDRIASDLSVVGGTLYRVEPDGTETEITGHRFLSFMSRPNPLYEMTPAAVWRLHEIYLMLVGESYLLIERDAYDRPVELWNVPPHWVKATPYIGSPYYQILSPGGLSMSVPVEDMFVMKQLNPLNPFMRGLGTAESIADEVEIDEYAAKFQKRFFYNDATPPIIFSLPEGALPEQRDVFMAKWNQKQRGVENSHKAAAMIGNITVHELRSADGKNLGFLESREAMRDSVLEHFGVPREIMGITENSNRATADSAQYIYAKNVLTPRIRNREEAINKQLLPLFGENLIWRYDAVIPYDKDFDRKTAIDAYTRGIITKNEARRLIDMDDVSGGDVFRVQESGSFMGLDDDPMDDLKPEEKALKRTNIRAILQAEERAASSIEPLFQAAITRHFSEQQAQIEKVLGLTGKADPPDLFDELANYILPDGTFDTELWAALDTAEQIAVTERAASILLDWKAEAKRLADLFAPLWKQAYDAGAAVNAEGYGIVGIDRPEFVSYAKVDGGRRVVNITETTRKQIAKIISDGVENGSTQNELRKSIQAEMGTTKSRAKLIARQETAMSLACGQFDMMRSAGATEKTWHHRPQKDPRDGTHGKVDHVSMEGETVGIDQRFSNGLRFPRDPEDDRPEEVINCRCYLTYSGF